MGSSIYGLDSSSFNACLSLYLMESSYVLPANLYFYIVSIWIKPHIKIYISKPFSGYQCVLFYLADIWDWIVRKRHSGAVFFIMDHTNLKPSGPFGHGYRILGTLLIADCFFLHRQKKISFSSWIGSIKMLVGVSYFSLFIRSDIDFISHGIGFSGIVSVSFWAWLLWSSAG